MILTVKTVISALRKTYPHATLSTTDPTSNGLGVKHNLRGAKFPLCLSTVPIIKITIDKHPIWARDIEECSLRSDFFCDKDDSEGEQNTVNLETVTNTFLSLSE
jgi:hypothetical protein